MFGFKYIFWMFILLYSCKEGNPTMKKTGQTAMFFQEKVEMKVSLKYCLYLPTSYEESKAFPLIMFLHGSGERGTELSNVKKWGLPKMVNSMKIPFIVVSPQCPANQDWDLYQLKALLDNITNNYNVDLTKIYLTGLSMGGFATYEMAIKFPNYFAAIAPLSAGGRTFRARKIAHLPIWAFHGAKDMAVPLKLGKDMIEAINQVGGNAKLTIFPEAGHICWDEVYADRKLYDWFLSHKK